MRLIEEIITFFMPASLEEKNCDYMEAKNRRLFISFELMTFAVLLLFTLMNYACKKTICGHFNLVGIATFLFSLFHYKYFGKYYLAVITYLLGALFVLTAQQSIASSAFITNLVWLPLIMIISFHLTGAKYGKYFSSLAIVATILAETFSRFSTITYVRFTDAEIYQYNIIGTLTCLLVSLFVASKINLEVESYQQKMESQLKTILEDKESTSGLLSIVCHDIANPLSIIKLQSSKANKKMAKNDFSLEDQIKSIQKNVENITEIIFNLKNLMAVQKGKLQLKLSPVDIGRAVEHSLRQLDEKFKEKEIKTTFRNNLLPEEMFILSEPISLSTSVINNLLTNALKFSQSGGEIKLEISKESDFIKVSVEDNGIGIPTEMIPYLFSGSKPTNRTGTNGEKGTGFGLPIIKMFMDRYQGHIEVQSLTKNLAEEQKTGTTFHLYFKPAPPPLEQFGQNPQG